MFIFSIISYPLAILLFITGWRKTVIQTNIHILKLNQPFSFLKFYHNIAMDLIISLTNYTPFPTQIHSQDLLQSLKSGGILLTAHLGNFEQLGKTLLENNIPICATHKPLKNKFWNKILSSIRKRKKYTLNTPTPKNIILTLKTNKLFTLLNDQHDPNQDTPTIHNSLPYFISNLPIRLSHHTNPGNIYFAILLRQNSSFQLYIHNFQQNKNINIQYLEFCRKYGNSNPHQWYNLSHRIFKRTHSYL
jgi:KDO2-lipid IV(A) lauroyltransferase